ncbi:J domain-containing protein [Chitinimonas lacunae]|uniref:J domain-containing protein n=1 Tax=Chitinimonas lacunae TaxID=1963018 RepID=A0ABV8MVU5_9NEIS
MSSKNHYQLFGLSSTASPVEIEAAYQRVKGLYQRNGVSDEARLDALAQAYSVLSDPLRRRIYDRSLEQDSPMIDEAEPVGTANLGLRLRWLAVALSLLLLALATVWWVRQRPTEPVPVDAAVVLEGHKPVAAAPDAPASANGPDQGKWQRKYAELVELQAHLREREQQLHSWRNKQLSRRDSETDGETDQLDNERYERTLQHEIEWLTMRIDIINQVELKAAAQGTLMKRQVYQPPVS